MLQKDLIPDPDTLSPPDFGLSVLYTPDRATHLSPIILPLHLLPLSVLSRLLCLGSVRALSPLGIKLDFEWEVIRQRVRPLVTQQLRRGAAPSAQS